MWKGHEHYSQNADCDHYKIIYLDFEIFDGILVSFPSKETPLLEDFRQPVQPPIMKMEDLVLTLTTGDDHLTCRARGVTVEQPQRTHLTWKQARNIHDEWNNNKEKEKDIVFYGKILPSCVPSSTVTCSATVSNECMIAYGDYHQTRSGYKRGISLEDLVETV